MAGFEAKTARSVFPVGIKAPVEKVFPLCCPVEEYKWIPSWKCDLVYCPNDKIELGTVFREISSAPFLLGNFRGKTTWTAVLHDRARFKLHFRLDNEKSSSLYKIELENDGNGETLGRLDFTYTATNKNGNKLVERNMEEKLHIMLSIINAMLEYYCETGEMMTFVGLREVILSSQGLTVMDKILMGLNRIAVSNMKDNDRGRFMRKFYGT